MDKTDKHENILERAAISCGSVTAAYSVAVLCFVAVYCAVHVDFAVTACLVLACLVPFAVMPLVYAAIHRFSPLLFGRYHLLMPLASFAAALCFVSMFAATDQTPVQSCVVFFGAMFCAVALAAYRYCSFSVRVRWGYGFDVPPSGAGFALFGAISAIACMAGFYHYDPQTAFANTAYVLAALGAICAIGQYLATYYSVPKFSGGRAVSVKRAFSAIYGGLDKRMFVAAVLSAAVGMTLIGLAAYFCLMYGLSAFVAIGSGAAAVAAYAATSTGLRKSGGARSAGGVMLAAYILSVVMFAVCACVDMPTSGVCSIAVIATALAGAGLASGNCVKRLRLVSAKPDNTIGTAFILSLLADCGGAAIFAALAATVIGLIRYGALAQGYAFLSAFCAGGAIAIVAFVLLIGGGATVQTDLTTGDGGSHGLGI